MKTIYEFPVPATSIDDIDFTRLEPGIYMITFKYETDARAIIETSLIFSDVVSYKYTSNFGRSLFQIEAYAKVVDLEAQCEWFQIVNDSIIDNRDWLKALNMPYEGFRHLMIYFDEGPCYEFICHGFDVKEHRV